MPNKIQQALSKFKSRFNDVLFGSDSGPSGSLARGRSGRSYWLPGTGLDWDQLAGDLWEVPGVAACLNYEWRNIHQMPPQVVTGEGEEQKAVPNHRLIQLFRNFNPEYDLSVLLHAIIGSWECDGNAYIAIERATPRGLPRELWYLPHFMVTPRRDKRTGQRYYEYRIRGLTQRIEPEDLIHLRHGMDPLNPLRGLAPLAALQRDGYVLQQGSTYSAKAMRNGGIVGGLVTPKEPKENSSVQYDFEPKDFMEQHKAFATGDKAGGLMAYSIPLEMQFPNATPQDMMIDKMLDRPEANVAAAIGLPPQVVGLHVGREAKTYANQKEAREIAFEEKLVPTGNLLYGQIGAHLLPQMSLNAAAERCCLDISEVRPLQPDLDALYKRAGEAWEANLIDRFDWAKMVGRKPDPADKGLFFSDVQAKQAEATAQIQQKYAPKEDKKPSGGSA